MTIVPRRARVLLMLRAMHPRLLNLRLPPGNGTACLPSLPLPSCLMPALQPPDIGACHTLLPLHRTALPTSWRLVELLTLELPQRRSFPAYCVTSALVSINPVTDSHVSDWGASSESARGQLGRRLVRSSEEQRVGALSSPSACSDGGRGRQAGAGREAAQS